MLLRLREPEHDTWCGGQPGLEVPLWAARTGWTGGGALKGEAAETEGTEEDNVGFGHGTGGGEEEAEVFDAVKEVAAVCGHDREGGEGEFADFGVVEAVGDVPEGEAVAGDELGDEVELLGNGAGVRSVDPGEQ